MLTSPRPHERSPWRAAPRAGLTVLTWLNAVVAGVRLALYANLRTLDKAAAKIILVEEVPPGEKWDAVRDRVKRAATAENIVTYDQDIAAWVADYGEEGGPG